MTSFFDTLLTATYVSYKTTIFVRIILYTFFGYTIFGFYTLFGWTVKPSRKAFTLSAISLYVSTICFVIIVVFTFITLATADFLY